MYCRQSVLLANLSLATLYMTVSAFGSRCRMAGADHRKVHGISWVSCPSCLT